MTPKSLHDMKWNVSQILLYITCACCVIRLQSRIMESSQHGIKNHFHRKNNCLTWMLMDVVFSSRDERLYAHAYSTLRSWMLPHLITTTLPWRSTELTQLKPICFSFKAFSLSSAKVSVSDSLKRECSFITPSYHVSKRHVILRMYIKLECKPFFI